MFMAIRSLARLPATPSCLGIELFLELDSSDFSLQFIDLLLQSP